MRAGAGREGEKKWFLIPVTRTGARYSFVQIFDMRILQCADICRAALSVKLTFAPINYASGALTSCIFRTKFPVWSPVWPYRPKRLGRINRKLTSDPRRPSRGCRSNHRERTMERQRTAASLPLSSDWIHHHFVSHSRTQLRVLPFAGVGHNAGRISAPLNRSIARRLNSIKPPRRIKKPPGRLNIYQRSVLAH